VSPFPFLGSFTSEYEVQMKPDEMANPENLTTDFKEYFPENVTS
jgi:hypothetical protein